MQVDETVLIEYALGILDPVNMQTVEQAVERSKDLQSELASIMESLQIVAVAEQPVDASQQLRNKVLSVTGAEHQNQFSGFIGRFAKLFDLSNTRSDELLAKIQNKTDPAWQSIPFPGVTILKFDGGPAVSAATCGIVAVSSGTLFPAHRHTADEAMMVLQGEAIDDGGNLLSVGDQCLFKAGSSHSFRVISDQSFIFGVVLHKANQWLWLKTLLDIFRLRT
ncbi:MAG: cupin domain-containing protein [Gammaproteobacteria bacterium]|nr:cupin domain-containing protein [Gammaproteobacteria bacterium]